VDAVEVFKTGLDGFLSNLVWWKVSLPMAGGLELDDQVSSKKNHSMILQYTKAKKKKVIFIFLLSYMEPV